MKDNIKELISDELKKLRFDNKLTQTQLAKKCGVDTSTIVRYEKNNVTMQVDTIMRILDAYGISSLNFFENILAKTHKNNE